jgi:hypothetical protein
MSNKKKKKGRKHYIHQIGFKDSLLNPISESKMPLNWLLRTFQKHQISFRFRLWV